MRTFCFLEMISYHGFGRTRISITPPFMAELAEILNLGFSPETLLM